MPRFCLNLQNKNKEMMKKILFTCVAVVTLLGKTAFSQSLELPQPSPWAQVSQKFGLAQATITYSRPGMKGRTIFGGLVPYGEIWRTGANKATELKLEGTTMINNQKVDAGSYSLFTIPGEKEWTIIINKNTELWGAGDYKKEEDLMRFTVKPSTIPATESFTIAFTNISSKSATVELSWATTKVSFDIINDYLEEGKMNIEAAIKSAENTLSLYNSAAQFYLDNNIDNKMALEWSKKSVAQGEKYWNLYNLARAYAANGMKAEAIETATKSHTMAVEAENTGFAQTVNTSLQEWKMK